MIFSLSKNDNVVKTMLQIWMSLRLQMETYLKKDPPKEILTLGHFLKQMVDVLDITHKQFAEYIGYQESNLSALLNDKRRINTDLAMKFGEIFGISPVVFLHIQSKNELLEIARKEGDKYKRYKLSDLLEEVGA